MNAPVAILLVAAIIIAGIVKLLTAPFKAFDHSRNNHVNPFGAAVDGELFHAQGDTK